MKAIQTGKVVAAIAIAAALGACSSSSWQRTDKETGTATGAVGGAVAGAVVAGPPGAVVGGVGGAIVGHETTGKDQVTTTRSTTTMHSGSMSAYDSATIQRVQRALNDKGYNAGPIDGQYGASTQDAVRRFQQASGLPATGALEPRTLSALGVS
jgi:putative peptidoglycan binding protein